MKYLISFIIVVCLFISCKKEDTIKQNEESEQLVHFFSADAGSEDALLLSALDSTKTYAMIAYASFGADQLHQQIKSLVFRKINGSFFGNLILHERGRPKLLYLINNTGEKDNVLFGFSYPSIDTIVYKLHYYNWESQEDSLLQEQRINTKDFSSQITYGKPTPDSNYWSRTEVELKTIRKAFELVFNETMVIKPITNANYTTNNLINFISAKNKPTGSTGMGVLALQVAKLLEESEIRSRMLQTVKSSDFSKPSDNQEFANLANEMLKNGSPTVKQIPNPSGTPQNPKGYTIVGKWKLDSLYELGVCRSCIPENQIIQCYGVLIPSLNYALFSQNGYSAQGGSTITGCYIKGSPSCDWNFTQVFNSNYFSAIDGCTGQISPNVNYSFNGNTFSYLDGDGIIVNCDILELNNSVLKYKYKYLYSCLSQQTERILKFHKQ